MGMLNVYVVKLYKNRLSKKVAMIFDFIGGSVLEIYESTNSQILWIYYYLFSMNIIMLLNHYAIKERHVPKFGIHVI